MTGQVVRATAGLMWADLVERVRRYSFLVVLAMTVIAGYSMIPPTDAPYVSFAIAGQRAVYNSAWVGTIFGTVAATMISLLGFFVIRNAVVRDYQTRVGQILAGTPINNLTYLFGKMASNLAVLVTILIVLSVVAPIMQLVRGESANIDIIALLLPMWTMALPCLAIVAAIALLFDTIAIFRGGLGNVVFIGLWMWQIIVSVGEQFVMEKELIAGNDLVGLSHTMVSLKELLIANGVDLTKGITDLYQPVNGLEVGVYLWSGLDWSVALIAQRFVWVGLALAIVLLAILFFDRFDPAKWSSPGARQGKGAGATGALAAGPVGLSGADDFAGAAALPFSPSLPIDLRGLRDGLTNSRFWTVFISELRLMLQGRPWWWFAVALGLVIANPLSPESVSQRWLTPLAWLWPLFIWSAMGARARINQAHQILSPIRSLAARQIPALWMAGFTMVLLTGSGTLLRLLLSGDWPLIAGWLVGGMFVPALAMTMGVWTGGRRTFETIYLILWLLGMSGRTAWLDYTGVGVGAADSNVVLFYLAAVPVLIWLGWVGRRRRSAG